MEGLMPIDREAQPTAAARPRVLVLHCLLQPHGGTNGVLVWTLQALCGEYDVTLLTWKPFDLSELNRYFGTSLEASDFQTRHIHPVVRRVFDLDPDPGSMQKNCWLMRLAKRMRRDFDVVLTTDNESDLGAPALQYVHAPNFAHLYPKVLHSLDLPWHRKLMAIGRRAIRPWMLVAGYSFDRMKRNRTIVNSDWTGRRFRAVYQAETITLYPPAAANFARLPWADREDGFVVIGRLNPDKRPDWCLRVLEVVRRQFPSARLHIIGSTSPYWGEAAYYKTLTPLIEANASWVTLHENVSREEMGRIVSGQRYGLHAMRDEHFGMAPAEMVLAGCIPFVHNSGGQVEIVGHDARLIYDSAEEAAERILHVLRNPSEQAEIRARLDEIQDRFRPEAFMRGIRAEVSRFRSRSPD